MTNMDTPTTDDEHVQVEHVSLDLETMGNQPTAAIVQIGAYHINGIEDEPDPERLFRVNVDLSDSIRRGAAVDGETIYWWLEQSEHARKSLVDPEPIGLVPAIERFDSWLRRIADPPSLHIWAHATFDPVLVREAFHAAGVWWGFSARNLMDLRTLIHFPDHERVDIKRGHSLEHDAGYDAFAQGQDVARALAGVERANALIRASAEAEQP